MLRIQQHKTLDGMIEANPRTNEPDWVNANHETSVDGECDVSLTQTGKIVRCFELR